MTRLEVRDAGVAVDAVPAMFPGLTWAGDELVVSFSTVPDGWPGGTIGVARSADLGATWSAPQIVVRPEGEQEAVLNADGLCTLSDGTLLMPYNGVRWTPGGGVAGRVISAHVVRSDDGGHTWSGGERVDAGFHGPCVYGRLLELDDGRIGWPIWGSRTAGERWRSVLFESADGGAGWSLGATIAYDPAARLSGAYVAPAVSGLSADGAPDVSVVDDPAFRPHSPIDGFSETTIVSPGASGLVAVLRQQGVGGDPSLQLFGSESADGGRSWSPYAPLGFAGMSPSAHRTGSGEVLLAYRRPAPEGGPGAPGVDIRLGSPDAREWSGPIALVDPHGYVHEAEYQCGYPAMVNLPDGDVLVVFYSFSPERGRFVAWNRIGYVTKHRAS